jgi:ergothioneine biosynthesis protein EgtB
MTPKGGSPASGTVGAADPAPSDQTVLLEHYRRIRRQSEAICQPLETEDYVVQTMTDMSPAKWHLAHTSWFFETFVLEPLVPGYRVFHPDYRHLFNSYYMSVGPMHRRPERGFLSRPTVKEVYAYRKHVDEHMEAFLAGAGDERLDACGPLVVLGLNHCQQHQELMLTDLKHMFSRNPLVPAYRSLDPGPDHDAPAHAWLEFEEGVRYLGHGGKGFCFDNEMPQHRVFLEAFRLGSRPVTSGEYLEFMEAGGYREPGLWLSDGWYAVQENDWEAPLYWIRKDGTWWQFTLGGLRRVRASEPVCHVSYYEADAYARWAGARLPTEAEWEIAAGAAAVTGNLLETDALHPVAAADDGGTGPRQLFGDVWEWTQSAYSPYPGYRPPAGALGEYNGKFMSGQMVLRGGSCATPRDHIRKTYRNFFAPASRWQFMGLRLAADAR